MRGYIRIVALVVLAVVALDLGGVDSVPGQARAPVLKLRQTAYGPILVNGQGRTLYQFSRDGRQLSRCGGACARTWPPFIARRLPRLGSGVREELVGTIRRPSGRLQVTYRGSPLYFYAHEGPRQVLCHNVTEFSGLWRVIDARGRAVP